MIQIVKSDNGYAVIKTLDNSFFALVKEHSNYDDAVYHAAALANLEGVELSINL